MNNHSITICIDISQIIFLNETQLIKRNYDVLYVAGFVISAITKIFNYNLTGQV